MRTLLRTLLTRAATTLLAVGLIAAMPARKVYICDSRTAYAYHITKSCSGLNRCSHEIVCVTLDEAVNTYGRRPCKICTR